MKDKRSTIKFIIECGIFIMLGIIIGILITNQTNKSSKEEEPPKEEKTEEVQVPEEKEPTTEEILSSIEGEWGMCLGEYNCRGLIISKGDNNKYTYTPYIMWSDGGEAGEIQKLTKTEDNTYKFEVYYKGYSNELGTAPERTVEYKINISELDSQKLKIEDNTYQKITGDRETFFKSIM